jgi:hypothetical protein
MVTIATGKTIQFIGNFGCLGIDKGDLKSSRVAAFFLVQEK